MEKREETLVLDGNTYTLREYDLPEDLDIKNKSLFIPVGRGERRVLAGEEMFWTVRHSLSSWSIVDLKGEPVKITDDSVRKQLPKKHLVPLFQVAVRVNNLEEEEKNA